MIIQLFFKDIMKEYFFQNIMDGRYTVNLYSHESNLGDDIEIIIDINNGIWKINEKNVSVYDENGKLSSDYELKADKITMIKSKLSDEKIGILPYENNEGTVIFKKYIFKDSALEVGKNGTIVLDLNNNINRYFTLLVEGNKMYAVPHINRIYHNRKLINDKKRIRFGDILSYKRFKLIYMGNIIAVNNPEGCVKCSMPEFKYKENIITSVGEIENNKNDEEEFIRSPRITHKIIAETIEIDPPTAKKETKERPLIYTVGPSLTMSMAMVVSVIFMIRSSSSGRSVVPSMCMALSMLMGAVLWPILSKKYNKKQMIEDEKKRNERLY